MHQNLINKIERCKNLEFDWDGYGAYAIPEKVIEIALAYLSSFIIDGAINVSPTGRKSIQFDFEDNTEIEIFEDRIEELTNDNREYIFYYK